MAGSDAEVVLSNISVDKRRLLEARMIAPAYQQVGGSVSGPSTLSGDVPIPAPVLPPPPADDEDEVEDSVGSFSSASNESILSGKQAELVSGQMVQKEKVAQPQIVNEAGSSTGGSVPGRKRRRTKTAKLEQYFKARESQHASESEQQLIAMKKENEELKSQLQNKDAVASAAEAQMKKINERAQNALSASIKAAARAERDKAEREVQIQCERLGRVSVQRNGTSLHEAWEEGRVRTETEELPFA